MKEVKKTTKAKTATKTTKSASSAKSTSKKNINKSQVEQPINSTAVVAIVIVIVLTIGILFGFNLLNKDEDGDTDRVDINTTTTTTIPKPTEIITEPTTTTTTTAKSATETVSESFDADTVAYYYKHYLIDNELYDPDTMVRWVVKEVRYLGYYKTTPSAKYFKITAEFECIDGSQKCIYIEQELEDDSTYIGVFTAKKANSKYTILNMLQPTFDLQVKNDPDTKDGFVLVDKVIK